MRVVYPDRVDVVDAPAHPARALAPIRMKDMGFPRCECLWRILADR